MPRGKRQMTLVELMIVVAIGGILMSIILPNLQRAKQRASRMRATTRTVTQQPVERSGQRNTIELPETAQEGEGAGAESAGQMIRVVLAAALVLVIVAAIRNTIRRRIGRANE